MLTASVPSCELKCGQSVPCNFAVPLNISFICHVWQRLWRPQHFIASFVLGTPPGPFILKQPRVRSFRKVARSLQLARFTPPFISLAARPLRVFGFCLWHPRGRFAPNSRRSTHHFSYFLHPTEICIWMPIGMCCSLPFSWLWSLPHLSQFCWPRLAISCHRGRRPSCELLHQAPPVEQGQLICKCSGVDLQNSRILGLCCCQTCLVLAVSSTEKVGSS